MTRLNTSPKSSGSLRRSAADAGALVVIWSWIGVRLGLDAVRSLVDRGASAVITRAVGSDAPLDPRVLDWTFGQTRVVSP